MAARVTYRIAAPMSRRWRHLQLFSLAVLALSAVSLVLAGTAFGDAFTPESGPTQNASDTDTLYKIVFVMGLAMIVLVWGVLFWALFRFRARRGVPAAQEHGSTALQLIWTTGVVGVVTAITIVALFFVDDIRDPVASGPSALAGIVGQNASADQPPPPGGDSLNIKVTGRQFLWSYQYPNQAVSFHDLVVPRDTTVTLDITTNDVAHSWWIPKLGGKVDALPQLPNKTWFKATKTGTFTGQCAELCGANHAYMTAKVIVVEPEQYKTWVENQKNLIDEARKAAQQSKEGIASSSTSGTTSGQAATGNFEAEGSKESTGGGGN
jgi:cytochrome c oxidase subunit 2